MEVNSTKLSGVQEIHLESFEDHRGEYVETYNKQLYKENGIDIEFVQDDYSWSEQHVLRGLHGDDKTWKLVSCPFGKYLLAVIDLNPVSSTFSQWETYLVSDRNKRQILIPPMHANGHLVLSRIAIFQYKQSEYYDRHSQFTIPYNDPKYQIIWPIENPILSIRDNAHVTRLK